jgi:hypothetical protein
MVVGGVILLGTRLFSGAFPASTQDDLIFVHHSVGQNWLDSGLYGALRAKPYIDEGNEITYGAEVRPDTGRPASLGKTPGDFTDMKHWLLWFNDYYHAVKSHGTVDGVNRIIMFKSCYPTSNVGYDGVEPGDPFSSERTLANYKAVYRHPNGRGHTYSYDGYVYKSLEDIFAENPDTLYIAITSPPRHYAPTDATNDEEARRAREFSNWLKSEWLPAYNAAHAGLNNVAIFDWFDLLAYPDAHPSHPNRLKAEHGGDEGDSHPNKTANQDSTRAFATDPGNFLDKAWNTFISGAGESQAREMTNIAEVPATRPTATSAPTSTAMPTSRPTSTSMVPSAPIGTATLTPIPTKTAATARPIPTDVPPVSTPMKTSTTTPPTSTPTSTVAAVASTPISPNGKNSGADDGLVFLHHSSGFLWLKHGLHEALLAKSYVDERNDISFESVLSPDLGRPPSLGDLPGYAMGMNHWILWFNDYLEGIKSYDSADGFNRIILFKSCFTTNNIPADGIEPGDPFSYDMSLTNYKAVYRHPDGPGNTYTWDHNGYVYKPLEDIFAENPDTLFVSITAPPRHYAPEDGTNDAEAHRARVFTRWLINDWLPGYNAAHPGLNNVAIFDWFDFLAYADDHPNHPNRLREEYGGARDNSHPNSTATEASSRVFASGPDNFIDSAWYTFLDGYP